MNRVLVPLLIALSVLTGCGCTEYHRQDLPPRDSDRYRALMSDVEKASRDLTVRVSLAEIAAHREAAAVLERNGIVRSHRGRLAFTPDGRRNLRAYFAAPDEEGDVIVGVQHVERLTFISQDEENNPLCTPYGGGQDDYGYVGRIVNYTTLGNALRRAHLLYAGFGTTRVGAARPAPGSGYLDGIFEKLHESRSGGFQRGERLGFPWQFAI